MDDFEFEVMDALYFTLSYKQLLSETELKEEDLKKTLVSLHQKGYIKYLSKDQEKEIKESLQHDSAFQEYRYLATKKGLLAHNGMT